MPWAYALDLRERVVKAFEVEDLSRKEVAELFGVGEATVYRWFVRKQKSGSVAPLKHKSGNPPTIPPERWELVKEIVAAEPDLTIREITNEYGRRVGRAVSCSAMSRVLVRLGLTRKKSR